MLVMLQRVLPFILTLMLGVGLASLLRFPWQTNLKFPQTASIPCGQRGGPACQKDAPLRIIYQPEPFYTNEARRNHVTGTVKLRMILRADGKTVSDITPLSELPYGLTEEAMSAASAIRFKPAIVSGMPTDTIQYVVFEFDGR
jgi:outer membrane biosynthesis protein TonB